MDTQVWEIRILPYPNRRRRALERALPIGAMMLLTAAFVVHAVIVCLETAL